MTPFRRSPCTGAHPRPALGSTRARHGDLHSQGVRRLIRLAAMRGTRIVIATASLGLLIGCSTAPPRTVTTNAPEITTGGSPSREPSAEPSAKATAPVALPKPTEPTAACLMAFSAWEKGGADTLDPNHKAVVNTLNACGTLAEWLGGLQAVPEALGYESAGELNETTVLNDLQIVCSNARTKVCRNAVKLGVLS